ncbi:MAG: TSUP family transporter [Devosia sp.]
MLDPSVLLALGAVGMLAGFVDAIAGGGGLISLPVLLSVGFSPIAAIATNKAQSIVGTIMAVITYWRRGFVSLRALVPSILASFAGSMIGAVAVKHIDTGVLSLAVPVALIVIAGYFTFAPRLTDENRAARLSFAAFVPLAGFVIGFYDGIFGPGTGSFFTMAFVLLFGLGITRAAANTKVLNAFSNLGALVFFMVAGDVVWPAAIAMAFGQIVGGYIGARTGIRFGAKLIRPLIIAVSMILALRLLFFR